MGTCHFFFVLAGGAFLVVLNFFRFLTRNGVFPPQCVTFESTVSPKRLDQILRFKVLISHTGPRFPLHHPPPFPTGLLLNTGLQSVLHANFRYTSLTLFTLP